jgi:hypothetical protein
MTLAQRRESFAHSIAPVLASEALGGGAEPFRKATRRLTSRATWFTKGERVAVIAGPGVAIISAGSAAPRLPVTMGSPSGRRTGNPDPSHHGPGAEHAGPDVLRRANSVDNYDYPLSPAMISVDNDAHGGTEAGAELSG